ncbi:lipoprotein insertase outer membrane protein LolB [Luteimonas kalidii]|uniref:lipoprotein insertase outer membrane protein LolB n=1 Tax=Luteimonas kalidii TaxID=3042025 RepID=UPI003CE58CC8
MSCRLVHALAVACVLLLGGCVSVPQRPPVPVDMAAARESEAQRGSLVDWSLEGRVAISNARQGGSGRLDWVQRGERYDLTLSAPVTRQGWRLSGDAASARLEGVEGGPREGADVEALLFGATGWEIPVRAMVDWVRGVAAPTGPYGPARVVHGAGNLPTRLEQAGWTIEYRDWFEAGPGQPSLPRRIEASRDQARVRLVVDGWTVVPGATTAPSPSDTRPAPDAMPEPDANASPEARLAASLQALTLDDPAADMRANARAGDLRPVGVCGFACLAPGFGPEGGAAHGVPMRILDGTGDVVRGEEHLALKHRAEAYARAYNAALAVRLRARPHAAD